MPAPPPHLPVGGRHVSQVRDRQHILEAHGLGLALVGIDRLESLHDLYGVDSRARIVESVTALLIGLNIRYKVAEGIGVRFTGLPD